MTGFFSIAILIAVGAILFAVYRARQGTNGPRNVVMQGVQYLSRPHALSEGHVFQEIVSESAWKGSYMKKHPELWIDVLTDDDKSAIHEAVLYFQSLQKTTEEMSIEDFPLSDALKKKIKMWNHQLTSQGRGFQVIRGVPVEKWTMEQCEIFFWAFGKFLGFPGAQDKAGSLLGHVTDAGQTNQTERPYRTREDIKYHCDGSDVVGLLCLNPAKQGGASRIISSVTVFNELLRRHADTGKGQLYAQRMFKALMLFTRKSFGISRYLPISPLRMDANGVLRTYWNQVYFLKSYRDESDGTLTSFGEQDPFALETIEAYDAILNEDCTELADTDEELGMSMELQQGDIQLLSNHLAMHARTEFEDHSSEDIAAAKKAAAMANGGNPVIASIGKRDLLRLWVSQSTEDWSWEMFASKQFDFLMVMRALAIGAIWYH